LQLSLRPAFRSSLIQRPSLSSFNVYNTGVLFSRTERFNAMLRVSG
jgi:hypothetical protein